MRITAKGSLLKLTVYRSNIHPREDARPIGTLLRVPGIITQRFRNDCQDHALYTDIKTESHKQYGNPIVVNVPVYLTHDLEAITADTAAGNIHYGNFVCRMSMVDYMWRTGRICGVTVDEAISEATAMIEQEVVKYSHYLRRDVFELTVRFSERQRYTDTWRLLTYSSVCYGPDPATNGMLEEIRTWHMIADVCSQLCIEAMREITCTTANGVSAVTD